MLPAQYRSLTRELASVADTMNRVFGELRPYNYTENGGSAGIVNGGTPSISRLPLDVWSNENEYFVTAYVPGVKPEDVDITFEGNALTIRGNFESENEDVNYNRRELFRGAFERQVTFNIPVDSNAIEANYENGVLKLRVPKAEIARPKQIKITAQVPSQAQVQDQ